MLSLLIFVLLGGRYGPSGLHYAQSHKKHNGPMQQPISQYQEMPVARQQDKKNMPEPVSLSRRKKIIGALRDKLPSMRDKGLKWNNSYIVSLFSYSSSS